MHPNKIGREKSSKNGLGGLRPDLAQKKTEFSKNTKRFRVTPQRPLQSHVKGFTDIKMVMYVQRVDFILDLFENQGVQSAEIIVGDSVVTKNRSSTEPEVFLKLAELIDQGKLSVRVPKNKRTFHEKWILGWSEGKFADVLVLPI